MDGCKFLISRVNLVASTLQNAFKFNCAYLVRAGDAKQTRDFLRKQNAQKYLLNARGRLSVFKQKHETQRQYFPKNIRTFRDEQWRIENAPRETTTPPLMTGLLGAVKRCEKNAHARRTVSGTGAGFKGASWIAR